MGGSHQFRSCWEIPSLATVGLNVRRWRPPIEMATGRLQVSTSGRLRRQLTRPYA